MPGENLTRIEAQERKALVEVESYDIELDLTTSEKTFRSTTTVRFTATAGASTFIDAITAEVHSVVLNGSELGAGVADGVRIRLDDLAAANELVVVADFAYTNTGEGLHRFVDPVDGEVYLYTQFEVPDSRRVFAVFEQPDLKASFRFSVTAPEAWQVVSTPHPRARAPRRRQRDLALRAHPRISSYITALVAGPYEVVRSELTSPTAARSRSASSPASRSSATSTRTTSSTSRARASPTSRRSSATPTRSRSTTSSSCPSSTRAPWRTRAP